MTTVRLGGLEGMTTVTGGLIDVLGLEEEDVNGRIEGSSERVASGSVEGPPSLVISAAGFFFWRMAYGAV